MDREEFIRLAVEALQKVDLSPSGPGGPSSSSPISSSRVAGLTATSHNSHNDESASIRGGVLYDRLTYDYAQLTDAELREILRYIHSSHKKNGDMLLLKRVFLLDHSSNDTYNKNGSSNNNRSQMVVASTVMENVQHGSSSVCASAALWQELFGLHIFFLLSHRDSEICFGEDTMQVIVSSYHVLDEAAAWESGRLVDACEQCIMRLTSWQSSSDEDEVMRAVVERFDVVCKILVDTISKMGTRARSSVVVGIFDMLLHCHCRLVEQQQGGVVLFILRMFRRRVAYIAASSIVLSSHEDNISTLIPYGQMMKILVDVVSPEVAMTRPCDLSSDDALGVDTAVCLEYTVGAVMNAHLKSVKSSLENILIQKGLYNYCIQTFIQSVRSRDSANAQQQQQQGGGVATALVLMACFSFDLRQWSLRVPGYVSAWQLYSDKEKNGGLSCRVLTVTWDVISSSSEPRHQHPVLTILHTLFCRDDGFVLGRDTDCTCSGGTEECGCLAMQQEHQQHKLGNLIQALEVLGRLSTALQYSVDSSKISMDDEMYQDLMEQIDAMRSDCRERMQATMAHSRRHVDAQDDITSTSPHTKTRPIIDSYRYCDTLLKDLKLILLNTTSISSNMKRE